MLFKSKAAAFDYLVVGLGNPGMQYENTRHNVGFMAVDLLAEKYGAQFSKRKSDCLFTECKISEKRIILAKPQTYMNLSGKAVISLMTFYKIPLSRVIVIFDDVSLDVGLIRMRRRGSHGGHNGIKDIIELAGSDEIMRIKIGVGKKPHPEYALKDWVLGKFPKTQLEPLTDAIKKSVSAVEEIVINDIDSAMNKYNS